MMRPVFVILTAVTLAACGADGEPVRPTANAGVSIGPNGITPNASIGATNGTFNVGLSL
ncbi:hypothetical protein Q4555_07600 [Octadecabacter sp. 1_MG-2023]|uniref:hypothetical protein n=1 Tax=unclassified Octadecabacter TaxID=196158 RepID=UPI001C08A6E9|nr:MULTISPECIES: hypothetical protein [unclassified Octadecabacter]MBU2994183.1 hypothetical protein [Octadecabacter sp. B2R22]MDO6734528.1 hypothetical protein [Octadecabacter sp. 1_MG-2023]